MSGEEIYSHDGILVARVISAEQLWNGTALNFWSNDEDFIQVGTWTHPKGTILPAHTHNVFERSSFRTQEVVYVVSGSILAQLYSEDESLIAECVMREGELLVCLNGGHGYTILEKDSRVLEIKNGPYLGPDLDRRRF